MAEFVSEGKGEYTLNLFIMCLTPPICHKSKFSISVFSFLSLSEDPVCVDVVRETLSKLVAAQYAERCPSPEPLVSDTVKEETTAEVCVLATTFLV